MILKGNLITLRSIEYEDIEFIRDLINDPGMETSIVGWAWPISKKDQEKWYETFSNSDKAVRFIVDTENNGPVGFTGLRNIDWKNGLAEFAGIRIVHNMQSNGFASDAYKTLMNYAFNELRLHRVNASALENNTISLKVMEKVGFKREGIQREAVYKNGQYYNLIQLGILHSDLHE